MLRIYKLKEYKIKKGKHSSGFHFGITFKKRLSFICYFDESCLYTIEDNDKYDINKLFGFSTTWNHHKQSGRVGWRCIDGKEIEIVTYSYNDGHRELDEMDVLGTVKPYEQFICHIEDLEDSYQYTFQMQNKDLVIFNDDKEKDWFIFHYLLYPYFGGNKTAPHDMSIFLKKLS